MGRSIALAAATAAVFLLATLSVHAVDLELTSDFLTPEGQVVDAEFFTFRGIRDVLFTPPEGDLRFVNVTNANLVTNFTALNSLGVSNALLRFPPGSVNRPHTHPRGSETLFVLEGELDVGLVIQEGTANRLIIQTIKQGEIFVFPRGLVHFQINWGKKLVTAYASFSSSSAGLIVLPLAIFGSDPPINVDVLARSFAVSPEIIEQLLAAN